MKIDKVLSTKEMVESVFPKTGDWVWSGDVPKSKNLPRNISNKQFVEEWVKTEVLTKYNDVNIEELEKFFKTKKFANIVKDYQHKIIDLQIEKSYKSDTGLIVGCIVRNNPQKAVDELCKSVATLLTTYLNLDEKIVEERLSQREEDLFEKFSNAKPFSKVGYNPFEN